MDQTYVVVWIATTLAPEDRGRLVQLDTGQVVRSIPLFCPVSNRTNRPSQEESSRATHHTPASQRHDAYR